MPLEIYETSKPTTTALKWMAAISTMPTYVKTSDLQDSLGSDGDGGNDINDARTRTHNNQPVCGR